ncbi:MAG: hypothetical protein J5532_08270 [Lachnospiraceae bacterium]|nr:hypothetical protein [Lachnospiraceae bacterium]
MSIKKKVLLATGLVTGVILVLIGLCYLIPGYLTPTRKYRKMVKLVQPYIIEEFYHDTGFSESKCAGVLSMSPEEYQGLKETLIAEGCQVLEGEDLLYSVNYTDEKTEGDKTELIDYYATEDVFLNMFDNCTYMSLLVLFHEGKVHVEYMGNVTINHAPFAAIE